MPPFFNAGHTRYLNSKSEYRNPKWFDFAHHPEPVEGQIQKSNVVMTETAWLEISSFLIFVIRDCFEFRI
jgi:hypothetical protein